MLTRQFSSVYGFLQVKYEVNMPFPRVDPSYRLLNPVDFDLYLDSQYI